MRNTMSIANGIIFLTQFGLIYSALPPIQKCSLSDSKCITASAQSIVPLFTEGIPEFNIKTLDPLEIKSIKVDLSGLKLDINNAVVVGLKKTVIEKIEVDMAKKNIQLVFHVDVSLKGKYKASGQLLILPISGDGDVVISTTNCQMVMDMPFEISKDKNGKDIINLKSYKYSFEVRDAATYQLTNLFNGNKELSETLLKFMNENWKILTLEFGQPVFDKPMLKVFKALKIYFSSQPMKDIANV